MKKIISIILFFLIFEQSFAVSNNIALECFRYKTQISSSKDWDIPVYFQVPYSDIYAEQNWNMLSVISIDAAYKYIPFTTNIVQENENWFYDNRYSFWDIDSDINRELTLSFERVIQNNSFALSARFDTQYYRPLYYISEDWENYSLVLKDDISDFDITNIRIKFEPSWELPVREIIKISDLSMLHLDSSYQISPVSQNSDLYIYAWNSCWWNKPNIKGTSSYSSDIRFVLPSFFWNSLYSINKQDSDSDGISDLNDNCINIPNRNQEDINSNLIGDACEFDSDSDGISDSVDNCRNIPNPLQFDDDKDTIWNSCDNCNLYNPDQRDENNNNVWDICESTANYLSENDDDGDLIINFRDNCRYISNPGQEDTDTDGVGNLCDNCMVFKNPKQEDSNKNGVWDICEDSDADGIDGLQDNCINIANPDQNDSDNDGIGNVCEDDDNDEILFINDNCPYVFNPDQKDTDSDGVWDTCDSDDNRILESNKTVFILLMFLIIIGFWIWIFSVMRQLKK